MDLAFGRGSLATLQAARVTRTFPRLLGDLTRLNAAGAALRLARDLVSEDLAEEETFEAVAEMLAAMNDEGMPAAPYQLAFEARLLALCGIAPLLSACGSCGKIPPADKVAEFDPRRGSLLCQQCGGGSERLSAKVRGWLIRAIEGEVGEVAREAWETGELRGAQKLIELFVRHRLQR